MDSERIKKQIQIPEEEFDDNWDMVFRRDKKNDQVMRRKKDKNGGENESNDD